MLAEPAFGIHPAVNGLTLAALNVPHSQVDNGAAEIHNPPSIYRRRDTDAQTVVVV